MDIKQDIKFAQKQLGIETLRKHQVKPINSILFGNDTMVIAPTSAGKSAIYQIPALIFPGMTLVIEPTLSLIYDQVNKLQSHGVNACHIDSAVPAYDRNRILERVSKGKVKILFVTPERLQNRKFLEAIEGIKISMVAIDECHCTTSWGYGFRPDYGKPGKLYRLRVQIEPCRVLGESGPTALAKMDKQQYKELVKAVDKKFRKLNIPGSIDKMKISRCDLTVNIEFSTQDELIKYLRIYKKILRIHHYRPVSFKKDEQKAKDYKAANKHSYCISCDRASVLIYDKIAQLAMIDRCDESLVGKHILRLEAELKRPALKTHLGKAALKTNYNLLFLAAHDSRKVIRWYLKRMQPKCKMYVRYEDAVKMVEDANLKKKTKKWMLYLLRKTSDSESLTAALAKLEKKYNLNKGQCRNVLKKFEKLGIGPITLKNTSDYDELPSIPL